MVGRPTAARPSRPLEVVLWGLGALGGLVATAVEREPGLRLVGAIDHARDKLGRRLADVVPGCRTEVTVYATLDGLCANLDHPPDAIVHMTESVPERIEQQLHEALRLANVITASEAMFYPHLRYSQIAARLDAAARAYGVTLTGVGINPGFIFDSLPSLLARVSGEIQRVEARRVVDVAGTGPHDIAHVGFGLQPEEFSRGIVEGRIYGHIGLPESVVVVAERLGMMIDRIEESWEVHTGSEPVVATIGAIAPGRVIGITQVARAFDGVEERIRMELVMFYEPAKFGLVEEDLITIVGRHTVRAAIRPACVSILGAALMITNAVADVVQAPPGLLTVVDLPIATRPRGGFTLALDPARPPRPGLMYLRQVRFAGGTDRS